MNNIYCENPKVIWHPHASKLVQKYRTFTMPSGIYHDSVLHVNKNHVNKNNIDKYTIVNPATGETFPMFLIVPCHKCPLCNEKKFKFFRTQISIKLHLNYILVNL